MESQVLHFHGKKLLRFVSTSVPYPYDLNGNSENIFNIIKFASLQRDVEIEFVLISDFNVELPLEFSVYVKSFDIVRSKNLKEWLAKDQSKLFACDYRSGRILASFRISGDILYMADSRSLYYSKHKDVASKLRYLRSVYIERKIFKYFNHIIFVSKDDCRFSSTRLNDKGVVVPIGYDVARLEGHADYPLIDFIFSGNMNY